MNLDHKPHFIFFSITEKGYEVVNKLESSLHLHFTNCDDAFQPTYKVYSPAELKALGGLSKVVHQTFDAMKPSPHSAYEIQHQTILVFTCAVGIAVRMLAPHIKDKLKDPACIVIDDHARFAISLLSGHVGKANAYTALFSSCLDETYRTQPVITTATDIRGIQGFEEIMTFFRINLEKNRHTIKVLNAALVEGKTVGLIIDDMIRLSKQIESNAVTIYKSSDAFFKHKGPKVIITIRDLEHWIKPLQDEPYFVFHSQTIVVGTGCRKNLAYEEYYRQLIEMMHDQGFSMEAIGTLSSVSLKANENCLLELSKALNIPFLTHTTEQLAPFTKYFVGSEFVKKTTGISAIAGPSAYILSEDELTFNRIKKEKCTFSLGRIQL